MTLIENKTFDREREFYGSDGVCLKNCTFDGDADGESALMLDDGETLEIRKAAECAAIVEFDGHDPYGVMSRKLGWSASARTTDGTAI